MTSDSQAVQRPEGGVGRTLRRLAPSAWVTLFAAFLVATIVVVTGGVVWHLRDAQRQLTNLNSALAQSAPSMCTLP